MTPGSIPVRFQWPPLNERPRLATDEVHLVLSDIDPTSDLPSACQSVLSDDELQKASRFQDQHDAARYIIARGLLRSLLGRYLDISPADIRFSYSPTGKPALARETRLTFNLSRSANICLYAFALDMKIGVDIEQLRDDIDFSAMSRQCFSTTERSLIASAASDDASRLFFTLWTCKQAALKAIGAGNAIEPNSFEVEWDARSPCPKARLGTDVLRIHPLAPTPDTRAALAAPTMVRLRKAFFQPVSSR